MQYQTVPTSAISTCPYLSLVLHVQSYLLTVPCYAQKIYFNQRNETWVASAEADGTNPKIHWISNITTRSF